MIMPHWVMMTFLFLLLASTALGLYRLVQGPTAPDRIVAFDILAMTGVCLMAYAAIETQNPIFLDIILVWSIVAFLGTAAFAGYYGRRVKK